LKLTLTAFSDIEKISEIEHELNAFIVRNTQNPFANLSFIKHHLNNLKKNSTPIFLVFKTQKKIVGFAPIKVTKKRGVKTAEFLLSYYHSPDFVFDSIFKDDCVRLFLDYILDRLYCQYIDLIFPANSINLDSLKKISKKNMIPIQFEFENSFNHATLAVQSTWDDFQKLKGKNFGKKIRQMENKLEKAGKLSIKFFEKGHNEQEILDQILAIEAACWKNDWRVERGVRNDITLINLWNWCSSAVNTIPNFRRRIGFLYLNDKAIAYHFAFEYRGTAYMCKTSFNNKYRNLYPGVYLVNEAIRDSFNSGNVQMIDFLTSLPFHERWTRSNHLRINVLLSNNFLLSFVQSCKRIALRLLIHLKNTDFGNKTIAKLSFLQ
jgi:hypothetical protein